jgi:spore coat protein CotH
VDTGVEGVGEPLVDLFDPVLIHEIEIELDSSARSSLSRSPETYVEGRMIWQGLPLDVGVRIKGSSSRDDLSGKPSFKIDFGFVREGAELQGQNKLNLHNMRYDPIMMSEELTYRMWRDAGLPASRTGYAWVTVNGDDYGLYALVEPPDDPLLARFYDDPKGNLYENAANYCDLDDGRSCFDAEEFDEGNHEAIDAFIEAARAPGFDALREELDWERYTGFLAMEMSIAHWDSYSFDQSNYRWYHEPSTDRWSLIPSSMDLGFGYRPWSYPDCGRHGVDPATYTMGLVSARCLSDPACEAAVLDKILLAADRLEAMDTPALLAAAADRIRDRVYDDPRRSLSDRHFDEHLACVDAWLQARPAELRAWVAARRGGG